MGRFKISREHSMEKEDVRAAAEELAQDMKSRFRVSYRWNGDTATFSGSGVKGELALEDGRLDLKVELGLLASAFEKPLKEGINEFLDEHLV